MTRFARSKGSKASNERVPEVATPWEVMKHQLHEKKQEILENKKRKEFEQSRMENYKAFLEQKEDDIKSEWVEFEGQVNKEVKKCKMQKKKLMTKDTNGLGDELKLQSLIDKIENVLDKDAEATCKASKINKKEKGSIDTVVSTNYEHTKFKKDRKKSKEICSSLNDITGKSDNENASEAINKLSKKKTKAKLLKAASFSTPLIDKTYEESVNDSVTLKKKSKTKKNKYSNSVHEVDNECGNSNTIEKVREQQEKSDIQKNKKGKMKNNKNNIHPNSKNTEEMTKDGIKKINKKKEIKLRQSEENKKRKKTEHEQIDNECGNSNTIDKISVQQEKRDSIQKNKKGKMKNNKNNIHTISKNTEGLMDDDIKKINKKKEKKLRQLENKKKKKAEHEEIALKQQENQNIRKRKLPKEKDNQEYKRRKPNSQVETININGVDIDIDYYDGFPVKKDDAQRLRKLRKEMISKGIPKSEVQISLKLERRKAEKALAREKKKVCFNCRKSGHVLSECPDLNKSSQQEVAGTGICFKCGSTEHTHFECKVVRNDNFKYATCFICREQGHISRQCPDNQRGLYPKGGACRECGDVTHLKKDCPKFQEKQESQTVKLDTLEFNNVEELPGANKNISKRENKSKKIVKF